MRKLLYLCFSIGLLLFGACKKVTKKVNSEKMFSLIFADSLSLPINQCYDRVFALGKSDLASCSNFKTGLQLPLNINSDSSIFYLQKGSKTDTLILKFKTTIEPRENEFEVFYDIKQIKGSFKNTSLQCIPELNPKCDGNKAQLSAVIFL